MPAGIQLRVKAALHSFPYRLFGSVPMLRADLASITALGMSHRLLCSKQVTAGSPLKVSSSLAEGRSIDSR
jgi:hypothetical protein